MTAQKKSPNADPINHSPSPSSPSFLMAVAAVYMQPYHQPLWHKEERSWEMYLSSG